MLEEKQEMNEEQKISSEFFDEYKKLSQKYKRDFKPILQNNDQSIFVGMQIVILNDKKDA